MAVNCLTKAQKTFLVDSYRDKLMTITDLARRFSISDTTVRRIVREAGEAAPQLRAKEEAHRIMTLLKKFNVGYYQLEGMLKFHARNKHILTPIATKQQVPLNFEEKE